MQRTQISLTDEDRAMLDRVGAETGRSMSELIRAAVRETYAPKWDHIAFLAALDASAGIAPYLPDGETYVEELRTGDRFREVFGDADADRG